MKKSILRRNMTKLTVIAALLCVVCGDDDKSPEWNGEADGLIGRMTGASFHTLTTNASPADGGTVSRSPEKTTYPSGAVVTVTAAAANGHEFTGWSGASTSTNAKVTVTMDGAKTLTANFGRPYTLTTEVSPEGSGSVSRSPWSPWGTNVLSGTSVTLTATAKSGFYFRDYTTESDGVTFADADSATTTFIMPAKAVTVTANFEEPKYTVSVSSAGIGATGDGRYAAGDNVTISAGTAPDGQRFRNWTTTSSGVTFANANSATTTFTMPANSVTVTAVFETIPTFKVTVSSAGTGATGDGSYVSGAKVTISAGTAQDCQRFKNWITSGSGVTFANANSATTTFTMPSNAVTVIADFERLVVDPNTVVKGTFTDSRDNQEYKTVKICSQVWMAENLNYAMSAGEGNSWCYGDNNSNCNQYGRLYDWASAMGLESSYNSTKWGGSDVKRQGVCPSGWHLPSDAEWYILVTAVGSPAGTKLKSTSGWNDNDNGTDTFGFSALPGGFRGTDGVFYGVGSHGSWWTAAEKNSDYAYYRGCALGYMDEYNSYKSRGQSVRCVQD